MNWLDKLWHRSALKKSKHKEEPHTIPTLLLKVERYAFQPTDIAWLVDYPDLGVHAFYGTKEYALRQVVKDIEEMLSRGVEALE